MIYKDERVQETIHSEIYNGFKVVIKSLGTHPCVYVGIEKNHPLAGFGYDDIPINVHGGLTYSGEGDGEYLPKGYFFYGWDYAHAGDFTGYDSIYKDQKKWTLKELIDHAHYAVWDFETLKKLSEELYRKGIESTQTLN